MLDLEAVEMFTRIAELRSFTRAAEAAATTQPAVSAKLKKLEASLGRVLVERHPRMVRLSAAGEQFLPLARQLLSAHADALARPEATPARLRLGISEHVAGPELPALIGRLAIAAPDLMLDVTLGLSAQLHVEFDAGEFDAVIIRQEAPSRGSEMLRHDPLGWFASAQWSPRASEPLPLVTLSNACSLRTSAIKALERAGVPWADRFLGGGIASVTAAIVAGLGVAPLSRRLAPIGCVDVTDSLGLPELPSAHVALLARTRDPRGLAALRSLAAGFRGTAR